MEQRMEIKTTTPTQLKAIHALFNKSGVKEKEDKAQVISFYTGGRTSSSREMSVKEAEALISHLKNTDPSHQGADRMRKKIISMAHEMGWKKPNGTKIDMEHVNQWCIKHGYLHKPLDEYTYEQLPTLVSQFEKAYKDFIKKV
jgi:hypothetical protein